MVVILKSERSTMNTLFVIQHVHELDDEHKDVKFIGVYSTRLNAEAAIERLSEMPGFKDTPDGFHIDEYRLDQDYWAEGFETVRN
jgi:hypothetical protein